MPTFQERLSLILNRTGVNTDFATKLVAEISKPEEESVDLETLITEFDNETNRLVTSKNDFVTKYVKPKVEEEREAEFKAIRGTIFSKAAEKAGLTNEEINTILNNGNKKFANNITDLVEFITLKKANTDDLTKAELNNLRAKEAELNKLLEDAKTNAEKAEKKSEKAEQNYYKKGIMLNAFVKLIPILQGNPDFIQETVFSKVSEMYDIEIGTGRLLYKGTDKPVFVENTSKNKDLKDVMYEILETNKLIVQKPNPDTGNPPPANNNSKNSNVKYFKSE